MARLDALFPGELPECPILGPEAGAEAGPEAGPETGPETGPESAVAPGTAGPSALADARPVRAGAPVGLAFGIPNLLCQIKPKPKPPPDPLPQRFADIRAATRAPP